MKPSIQNGDSVYIVDNARFVRMVIVLRTSRDYCIIRYAETGAVIRISKKRLYATENEALLTIPSEHRPKKMNHSQLIVVPGNFLYSLMIFSFM